ncbi:hypothetical protein QR77_24070 [Streptomyces sp. 150FB]|nr:hypothetical protein QR77_24070 [Streptomyces sp. 150FB]
MKWGKKPPEPPLEKVDWSTVGRFVISSQERPATRKRPSVTYGERAVRVPSGGVDALVLSPCAYLPRLTPAERKAAVGRPDDRLRDRILYEDPDRLRVLCTIDEPLEAGGDRHHEVRDADGRSLGTIRRVAPKRPFRHTWRIDHPGRGEITGRGEWANRDTKGILGHAAAGLVLGLIDSAAGLGADGGDQATGRRKLEWRLGTEVVMTSKGSAEISVHADWFDRRLAFAFALIGDF